MSKLALAVVAFLFVAPSHAAETKCPPGQRLDPCAKGSCPHCDDCVPGCVSKDPVKAGKRSRKRPPPPTP